MNYRFLIPISLFLLLGLYSANGQGVRLKGIVMDSTATPLVSATVVLIGAQDSLMVSYALTNIKGDFVINNINPGEYYIQITYIGYGNYRQEVIISGNGAEKDLGPIILSPGNILLEKVEVKAEHIPIFINNDTIEYNAAAFKTKLNAPVEELLRKLPGVDVQRDGSIKAQGETVQKLLVDGKEFFGNDPTIATRNLPADIVNRVQVFDKPSEIAEFTGIDDGQEQKTINLNLKEDKKQGYFGNIEGGIGLDDDKPTVESLRYRGKLNLNKFSNKVQLSILGMSNNNNDPGFSLNDYLNFMGGLGGLMSGGGSAVTINTGDGGVPIGENRNSGITNTTSGGVNFNFDANKKLDWQSSYFTNLIDNHTVRNTSSEYLGTSNQFSQLNSSDQNNKSQSHRLNTSLRYKWNPRLRLNWNNRFSFTESEQSQKSSAQSFIEKSMLENQSTNEINNNDNGYKWYFGLSVIKKLQKEGRILSLNSDITIGVDNSDDDVNNELEIFGNGTPDIITEILQYQNRKRDQTNYGVKLNYTEPLGNKTFLGVYGGRRINNTDNERKYFDIDSDVPSIKILNTQLSNHFIKEYDFSNIGMNIRYVGKSTNISGGITYHHTDLIANNITESSSLNKSFNYILPDFNLDHKFSNSINLRFTYRAIIQEPSLYQLQPIISNRNPVNLYQGNPSLIPEYAHNGTIHFSLFDQFSFTSLFVNLNSRYTLNKIVNQIHIDNQLRQTTSPVNVDNDFNLSSFLSFSTPMKFIKSKVSFDFNNNYNRGINIVNDLLDNTDRWTNSFTLTLENRKKEILDIAVGASLGISSLKYSENEAFDQNYFDQTYFMDLSLFFQKDWTLESIFDYTQYSAESFGSQQNQFIWQAGISKSFAENNRWTIDLRVFDILNQNKGIDRNNNLNYIQETRTNVLGRYFMLGVNYKLSNFSGNGGMQIEMQEGRRLRH